MSPPKSSFSLSRGYSHRVYYHLKLEPKHHYLVTPADSLFLFYTVLILEKRGSKIVLILMKNGLMKLILKNIELIRLFLKTWAHSAPYWKKG